LLVDDEPDITSLFRIGLEDSGFIVDTFNDPLIETFKQKVKDKKISFYDLALLDIKMPKMNGFELFNQIRQVNDKIKVCFITAFDLQKDKSRDVTSKSVFFKAHISSNV
jgi:DNA-binding response OmpR family regulator